MTDGGSQIDLNTVSTPTSVLMWQATNHNNRDFRLETFGANWTSSPLAEQSNGTYAAQVKSAAERGDRVLHPDAVPGRRHDIDVHHPDQHGPVVHPERNRERRGRELQRRSVRCRLRRPLGRSGSQFPALSSTNTSPAARRADRALRRHRRRPARTRWWRCSPRAIPCTPPARAPATFTITPIAPSLTVNDSGGVFNGNPFPANASAKGLGGAPVNGTFAYTYYSGTAVSGNGSSTTPTNAGTYTVVASFTSGNPDYVNVSSAPATFTITLATPTVVAVDNGGTYNGNPFAALATATGVGGATVSGTSTFTYYLGSTVSGTGSLTAPTNAGTYTVVASFTSTNGNYGNATSNPLTFTIAPPPLALYDGNYTGTYSGTSVVDNNGTITTSPVNLTAYTAISKDGQVAVTIPGGSGTGTIDSAGNVSGSVTIQIDGVNVAVPFAGTITAAGPSGTAAAGTWQYSANLGNGVVVSGNGSWTAGAAQVVTDFDGNYAGSYQGSVVVNNNGQITTSPVASTLYTSTISNGAMQMLFPGSTGLSVGTGAIGREREPDRNDQLRNERGDGHGNLHRNGHPFADRRPGHGHLEFHRQLGQRHDGIRARDLEPGQGSEFQRILRRELQRYARHEQQRDGYHEFSPGQRRHQYVRAAFDF